MTAADRCPRCDRAECEADAPMPPHVVEASKRILAANGVASIHDRARLTAHGTTMKLAQEACAAHAVDWRAETLRLRAEVAAMRPVVEAADAFTPVNRFRIDTYPKSAPVRLYDAVEEYRTTDAYLAALPKEPA
jgi:hypothetical protein